MPPNLGVSYARSAAAPPEAQTGWGEGVTPQGGGGRLVCVDVGQRRLGSASKRSRCALQYFGGRDPACIKPQVREV